MKSIVKQTSKFTENNGKPTRLCENFFRFALENAKTWWCSGSQPFPSQDSFEESKELCLKQFHSELESRGTGGWEPLDVAGYAKKQQNIKNIQSQH